MEQSDECRLILISEINTKSQSERCTSSMRKSEPMTVQITFDRQCETRKPASRKLAVCKTEKDYKLSRDGSYWLQNYTAPF